MHILFTEAMFEWSLASREPYTRCIERTNP